MEKTKLSYDKLLEYIKMILEMEKNVYIQKNTANRIEQKIRLLGHEKKIAAPVSEMDSSPAGISREVIKIIVISALIGGGAGLIIWLLSFCILPWFKMTSGTSGVSEEYNEAQNIGTTAAVISIIIVFIVASIIQFMRFKKSDKKYNKDMQNYKLAQTNEIQRLTKENAQKEYLQNELQLLSRQRIKTIGHLKKLYSYGIIEEEYRNIVAVSAFYHYLKTGMTRSLSFDPETHDDGAYKIYRQEMLLGKIITNTEIIIKKLDELIDSQNELKQILYSANKKVDNLVYKIDNAVNSIDNLHKTVSRDFDTMHRDSEISRYNQEITNNELKFMNTFDVWRW